MKFINDKQAVAQIENWVIYEEFQKITSHNVLMLHDYNFTTNSHVVDFSFEQQPVKI